MTDAEWQTCTDPERMLDFLRGKVSLRKLRLYGVSCCRRILHLLPDERSRRAVEVAEALADGLVSDTEADLAGDAASDAPYEAEGLPWQVGSPATRAVTHLLNLSEESWQLVLVWAEVAQALEGEQLLKEGSPPEMLESWSEQCSEAGRPVGWTDLDLWLPLADALRCTVGNPFYVRRNEPRWFSSDVLGLARGIYEDRAFDRMPILADALMDAGCDDADILAHCRSGGLHVRGCWVVDLILGKS